MIRAMKIRATVIAASPWPRAFCTAALVFAVVIPTARVSATSVAFDSAADPAYNPQPGVTSGWTDGTAGGYGWGGPWHRFVPVPFATIGFLGSSTTNGTGDLDNDGDINTPRNAGGRAWGLTASAATDQNPFGGQAGARRPAGRWPDLQD